MEYSVHTFSWAIAATRTLESLMLAGGKPGIFLFEQSRERPGVNEQVHGSRRAKISLATNASSTRIILPCRQRLGQVAHPTLEFAASANQVSMKVGTRRLLDTDDAYRSRLDDRFHEPGWFR
jgi:hypothetical protein